jgi:hypothetical protein
MGSRFGGTLGAAIVAVSTSGAVAAAEPSAVVVGPPSLSESAPEHVRQAMLDGVVAGVAAAGATVGAVPDSCVDASCMAVEVSEGRARAVVLTEVEIVGSDYSLSVELQASEGTASTRKDAVCEICTYEEAATMLEGLVTEAIESLGPAAGPAETTGLLRVTSAPSGATVEVDGVPVGTTPYEGSWPAGSHRIEVAQRGRSTQGRVVEIDGGGASEESFELPRTGGLSPATMQIVGWSAVGVGAASLIGGIAMLVLDNNGVKSNCDGTNVDVEGDCAFRYDTLAGGVALTVVGAAAIAGGTTILVIGRRNGRRPAAEVAWRGAGLRARF